MINKDKLGFCKDAEFADKSKPLDMVDLYNFLEDHVMFGGYV